MLQDNDFRVRNNAAIALCEYVKKAQATVQSKRAFMPQYSFKDEIYIKYVSNRTFRSLPAPLCHVKDSTAAETMDVIGVLAKVLYTLTNSLLEINNKDKQV